MRKFFFSLSLLMMAMNASAWQLRVGSQDDITASNSDVFGDGKVAVVLKSSSKTIDLTLKGSEISTNTSNVPAIKFVGDDTYNTLNIIVIGMNRLTSERSNTLYFENATVNIKGGNKSAENYLICSSTNTSYAYSTAQLQGNVSLCLGGNMSEPLVSIGLEALNGVTIFGAGTGTQQLIIGYANIGISSGDDKSLTSDITLNNPSFLHQNFVFDPSTVQWNSSKNYFENTMGMTEYKGDLEISAPYALFVAGSWVNEKNAADIWGDKTVIYNPAKNVLILEDAYIDGASATIISYIDDLTIYLKGTSYISTTNANYDVLRLANNSVITGDVDAMLYLYGTKTGIVTAGSLKIGDVDAINIQNVSKGIIAETDGSVPAVLTIGNTKVDIDATTAALDEWDDVKLLNNKMLINPAEATFSEIERTYVVQDEMFVEQPVAHLVFYFNYEPYDLSFCDVQVTAQNCSHIAKGSGDGYASYNDATHTLTIRNMEVFSGEGVSSIIVSQLDKLTVKLVGTSYFFCSTAGVEIDSKTISFTGNGEITITSETNGMNLSNNSLLEVDGGAKVVANGEQNGITAEMSSFMSCDEMYDESDDEALIIKVGNGELVAFGEMMSCISNVKELQLASGVIVEGGEGVHYAFNCANLLFGILNAAGTDYQKGDDVYIHPENGVVPTAVENVANKADAQKIFRDGQVLILRNNQVFNALGQEVCTR